MSYSALTAAEIAVGEPTSAPLFQKILDNFADHETRLGAIDVGATYLPPIEFGVFGVLQTPFAYDGLIQTLTDINITVTACRVNVKTAGGSGTLTIDVEYKRGGGAWTSILTAPVSVVYTEGNNSLTSGTLAVTSFNALDRFRLNVDSVQSAMEDFSVYLEREIR